MLRHSVVFFGITLSTLWIWYSIIHAAIIPPMLIGGILPISDAFSYFSEAWRLEAFGEFSEWGARRPLYEIYLNSTLHLTGFSLFRAQIVFLAIFLLCSLIFLNCIWRRFSSLALILCGAATLSFYLCFQSATLMSEQLGFSVGLISATFLIKFCQTQRNIFAYFSILYLSIGLNARPGAMFVIPFVLIGLAIECPRLRSMKGICIALLAAASPFVVSSILAMKYSAAHGGLFSNFSVVLYGLARGGKGWTLAYDEFPEHLMGGSSTFSPIYAKTFEIIANDPIIFIQALGRSLLDGLRLYKLLAFIPGLHLKIACYLAIISGIFILFRRSSEEGILRWILLGTGFSLPFLTDAYPRTLAATLPHLFWIMAVGCAPIGRWIDQRYRSFGPEPSPHMGSGLMIASIVIVALLFPWRFLNPKISSATIVKACSIPNSQFGWIDTSSVLRIVADNSRQNKKDLEIDRYLASVNNNQAHRAEVAGLSQVKVGEFLTVVFELCSKTQKYLVLSAPVASSDFYLWQTQLNSLELGGMTIRALSNPVAVESE